MSLSAGTKLGPYEIVALIGAGGMGEVYRARDTRLNRDVAIKVSAQQFTERFEREARSIAALNHPNICTLYDVGPNYLVMEYIEGEVPKGPYALEEALRIAAQIRDALEAAHEKGIVHRDLKPANIKIKPDGSVKVLDFGLAKVAEPRAEAGANSPTLTIGATQAGMILGTAGYMSPEQARGKSVDKRADIWAFGVVLWETLTGKPLFEGEDVGHTLAAVIMKEPDWDEVPEKVRRLLRRCLEKDPKKRLRDIGDAWELLADVGQAHGLSSTGHGPVPQRWPWVAAIAVIATVALAFVHFREAAPEAPVVRTFIPPPDKATFNSTNASPSLTLSPDGHRLVFSAIGADGKNQLWVRLLDALTAEPLPGTEGATLPFWSPDSRFIGFFAGGKLKKIDTSGGPPLTLCDAPGGRGGTWNQDGIIVFASGGGGGAALLNRVSASGGARIPLATRDRAGQGLFPWFLPDGRHLLYSAGSIRVRSVDSQEESRVVTEAPSNAVYAQGQVLFVREDTLMAQPFDVKRLVTTGEAVPVAEHVQGFGNTPTRGLFSASANGLLAYQRGGQDFSALAWFDRSGKRVATLGDPGGFSHMHFSPDRKSVAANVLDNATGNLDVWLYDVARGLRTRFTFDPAVEQEAIWSPDGSSIVFDSDRKGHADLYRKASSGAGAEELLYADNLDKYPKSWSPDGKFLLYYALGDPKTGADIWILPMTGERKPFLFARTASTELNGQFSPDGRWIVYQSDESQRMRFISLHSMAQGRYRRQAADLDGRWNPAPVAA